MQIVEKIFDECLVIEPDQRKDIRGCMEVFFKENDMQDILSGFKIKEHRMYKIPEKNTFFGIHYQNRGKAQGKLISVIQASDWNCQWQML